ncbi:hypothetical protein THASP1DRAFT_30840 [Thamnocephalis sphaerospora]|uniref:Uncharacterized protein n=1 Tax=Thamnocephalis sphaerospora TaxID=78915 RepID=A0A4P9XN33_9FUNG|nr:hypothetical protein THASP1DRAFT_30840 [Thamnocephalis sphaerospora]|eukprot:RKP07343.1 hypothetical protein THASP1DRAFT_30840 [Thamnocephalis sphaerospora]
MRNSSFKDDRASVLDRLDRLLAQLTRTRRRTHQCTKRAENQSLTYGGDIILLDDNMYYSSMRHACYRLAQQHDAIFLQLHVVCDLATAHTRNVSRAKATGSKPLSTDVLDRMHARFEAPCHCYAYLPCCPVHPEAMLATGNTQAHRAWYTYTVVWDASQLDARHENTVHGWIRQCLLPAWQQMARQQTHGRAEHMHEALAAEQERVRVSTDKLHQLNIALNRRVGQRVRQTSDNGNRQAMARVLRTLKDRLLQDARQAHVHSPNHAAGTSDGICAVDSLLARFDAEAERLTRACGVASRQDALPP